MRCRMEMYLLLNGQQQRGRIEKKSKNEKFNTVTTN